MKNSIKTLLAGAAILAAPSAFACQLTLWDESTGGVIADQPQGFTTQAVQRYSGLCGALIPDSAAGPQFVGDNTPANLDRIIARFYVLNKLDSGSNAIIFRGFSGDDGAGDLLFTVRLNSNGAITLIDNASGNATSPVSSTTDWASVEIDWQRGSAGSIELIVNGQSSGVIGVNNSSRGPLESVRLGKLNDVSGSLTFDAYESRRTQEIGRLCVGDADNSGDRGLGDLQAIFEEFQFGTLASGQPDADENGEVGLGDLQRVFEIFQFGTPACPT